MKKITFHRNIGIFLDFRSVSKINIAARSIPHTFDRIGPLLRNPVTYLPIGPPHQSISFDRIFPGFVFREGFSSTGLCLGKTSRRNIRQGSFELKKYISVKKMASVKTRKS